MHDNMAQLAGLGWIKIAICDRVAPYDFYARSECRERARLVLTHARPVMACNQEIWTKAQP